MNEDKTKVREMFGIDFTQEPDDDDEWIMTRSQVRGAIRATRNQNTGISLQETANAIAVELDAAELDALIMHLQEELTKKK